MKSIVLAIAIATATAPPVLAQGPLPFKGRASTSEDLAGGTFPNLLVALSGNGVGTQLGNFAIAAEWQVSVLTGTGVGTFTLTSANGDTIVGTGTGTSVVVDGIRYITETCVITGGTGRFAKATGTFVVARVLTEATHTSVATFLGTIDLH
jgi:hypothetical protein